MEIYFQGKTTSTLEERAISDETSIALAKAIKANKSLRILNLSNNRISDVGVQVLVEELNRASRTKLEYLDLSGNPFGEEGMQALTRLPLKVKTLCPVPFSIKDHHQPEVKYLDKLTFTGLTTLHLNSSTISLSEMKAFSLNLQFSNITKLYLQNSLIEEGGIILLARAIELTLRLVELNLSNSDCANDDALAIIKSLQINNSLAYVNLSQNNRLDCKDAILDAVQEILKTNKTITSINLEKCSGLHNTHELVIRGLIANRELYNSTFDLQTFKETIQKVINPLKQAHENYKLELLAGKLLNSPKTIKAIRSGIIEKKEVYELIKLEFEKTKWLVNNIFASSGFDHIIVQIRLHLFKNKIS